MNITIETAEAIAKACDAELRTDYSGRGMYGDQCVGFDMDGARAESRITVAIAKVLNDTATNAMLGRLTTDSMGLGIIVYFPGITVTNGE